MPGAHRTSILPRVTRRVAGAGFLLVLALAGPVSAKPKLAKHAAPAPETPPSAAPSEAGDLSAPPTAAPEPTPEPPPTAAKPAHATSPEPAPDAPLADEKLAALRADVTALVDDMVQARSRAALLGKTLFKTQVRVRVQNLAAPDPVLVKIVLKLDGAPIFRSDGTSFKSEDPRQVFQGYLAPGAHVLSAEIEQRSRDDAAYGYALHESYRFQALREKRSELTLVLDDDSNLASDFPDDAKGEYDVRVKLRVRTRDLSED
jgi:hypothetical protein